MIDLRTAVILGIDPAMTATGIASCRAGTWRFATVRTSTEDGPAVARWGMILRGILEFIPWMGIPVYVAIEEYPWLMLKLGARGAVDRLGLRGVLLHELWKIGVSTVEVSATAIKAYAGGGDFDKKQMVASARAQGVEVRDSHQADAYWLARMYVDAAAGAESTVEWPGLNRKEPQ